MNRPSLGLLAEVYPDVPVRDGIGEFETLLSIGKARRLLSYEPRHSWRDHVNVTQRHSVQFTIEDLCGLVGVPESEVTFLAAGVNHQAFILRFEHAGESLYPRLDARIAADLELQRRVRVALYRRLGFYPTESSEHAAEYVPWFMTHDDEIAHYRIPIDEYIRRSEANLDEYARVKVALARGEAIEVERSNEYASVIVNSMVTGEPSVIYGNVPNRGLITGLPEGACVEVPCLVDRSGVRPTTVPEYPAQLAALNRTYANVVELTVRAVLESRPDHIRHAAMLDPATAAALTLDEIDALCDELTLAHGELIPAGLRATDTMPIGTSFAEFGDTRSGP